MRAQKFSDNRENVLKLFFFNHVIFWGFYKSLSKKIKNNLAEITKIRDIYHWKRKLYHSLIFEKSKKASQNFKSEYI